ncbi:MAG TPA: hypothetical protein VLT16_12095 [Candidatus Limnocylindrales bacterium]|nr:hypothetical protein [Candidatus Limnocylindrales bacterium]
MSKGLDLLYGTPGWLIILMFLLLLLAAAELGFRLGRRAAASTPHEIKSRIGTVEGALLGVLGLLLGFTMAMAVTRFDARRSLVVDEANALGTTWLRTRLMPEPESSEMAGLLRQYVEVRLRYAGAGTDPAKLGSVRRQAAQLQQELWSRAVAFARKDPRSVPAGLLLQSLNQSIDLEAARWTAFLNHVPNSVIYVNGGVALLAMTLAGYGFGMAGRRHGFSSCVLAISIVVVMMVIIDLDRPRRGFIQVSQQPLIDLQRQMGAPR